MRIVTVSTGIGNVRSVVRALERVARDGTSVEMAADPSAIRAADVLVVPGQGAFGAFAEKLTGGLREVLVERIAAGVPYLGICLGLQVLFETSDEAPGARGLGVLSGHVRRLEPGIDSSTGRPWVLPHVGWNNTAAADAEAIAAPAFYYFAHSYVAAPAEASVTSSTASYGDDMFTTSVRKDNVVGVQFHPEKSQAKGLALLEQFLTFAKRSR